MVHLVRLGEHDVVVLQDDGVRVHATLERRKEGRKEKKMMIVVIGNCHAAEKERERERLIMRRS